MTPEEIKSKNDVAVYIHDFSEKMGHAPLAIGLREESYCQVVREMHGNPKCQNLYPFINQVLLVSVDRAP